MSEGAWRRHLRDRGAHPFPGNNGAEDIIEGEAGQPSALSQLRLRREGVAVPAKAYGSA